MSDDSSRSKQVDPRDFACWFLEQEKSAHWETGLLVNEAEMHLCRAIAFLEQDLIEKALVEANLAARLDSGLHVRALLVARMCIQREIDRERS